MALARLLDVLGLTARAGSYLAIIPIIAPGIAWVWLREAPTGMALVGGVVVFMGVMG